MSALDKNREFCARMMREDPYNAPKWEMVRRWANKDCDRELVVGYELEKCLKDINEWIIIDERDMPVLEVVAGTLLVCGDEPRVERLMKAGREDLQQRLLCEVWEEIIRGADNLIESGWKPPEPAPPLVINAKQTEPEPPPAKGGRPADPERERYFKWMVRKMWNEDGREKGKFCEDFLRKYPQAAELFIDSDNLRTQFGQWLNKKPKS